MKENFDASPEKYMGGMGQMDMMLKKSGGHQPG